MKIRKAIITSAGFGTRLLPITKTIQKEMVPILDQPAIQYVVESCVAAGIEEIIFVINEHNKQIKHYFSENVRLEQYLKKMNKGHLYPKVARLHQMADFRFIEQPDAGRYGTAIPVELCRPFVDQEEAFLVLMGDDFIYHPDGSSDVSQMINVFDHSHASGLVTCIPKEQKDLSRYGIIAYKENDGQKYLDRLVEKPAIADAPSNLANISKYIFTPAIFPLIEQQKVDSQSGELYITDTATTLAQLSPVVVYTSAGAYLDSGNTEDWLKANLVIASGDAKIREMVITTVKEWYHL